MTIAPDHRTIIHQVAPLGAEVEVHDVKGELDVLDQHPRNSDTASLLS
jgi:hypothetical protein